MSGAKKKTPAEELIESLLKDMGVPFSTATSEENEEAPVVTEDENASSIVGLISTGEEEPGVALTGLPSENANYDSETKNEFESTHGEKTRSIINFSLEDEDANKNLSAAMGALVSENAHEMQNKAGDAPGNATEALGLESEAGNAAVAVDVDEKIKDDNIKTEVINDVIPSENQVVVTAGGDSDKTVAVAGYQVRSHSDYDDKVRISVGQNRISSGYQAWNSGGSAESNLGQAENLRIAQEKIIELEQENDKLRLQNEELMAASEIIKERSDLLSAQVNEYKNDRDSLEDSFKNEIVLLKNHLARKDAELQRAQFKTEELDSRLKFDMKKIRIRERELENRLELIRAEKNAVVKNKDEQILDLRRKMDVLQMEVESYRQKCVELNKSIESSQESFKRTTRALRLAMANLELQEDSNKAPLKKVD